MKLKNKTKFLLVFGIIFVSFLLFNANKVQANSTTEEIKVELTADFYDYGEEIDGRNGTIGFRFKNSNSYTAKEFKEIQQYLKNNNLDTFSTKVYINIPDTIKEVKSKKDNKEYNILEQNGKKYIEYNVEIAKIFNDVSEAIYYYLEEMRVIDILQCITEDNQIKVYEVYRSTSNYETFTDDDYGYILEYGSFIANGVGDLRGDYIDFDNSNLAYSRYWKIFGRGVGWSPEEWEYWHPTAQTNINYIGEYIYLQIPYNVGQSLTAKISGTNKSIEFSYFKECDSYEIYRAEITKDIENIIFNKAQTIKLTYTTQHSRLDLPYTFEFPITVEGSTRTNIELNDKENIKIDFNGVLPTDVIIKAEEIEENTETYKTLSTTGIDGMVKYYNRNSLTHLLFTDITTLGGNVNGAIQLTFNVGEQYNGRFIYIAHKKHNGEYEYFRETVADGKVTIIVNELSPFIVAVEEKIDNEENNTPVQPEETPKVEDNTNKGEKDETPKTGTIDIISYVLGATLLSGVGIVTLKKKLN